MKKLLDFNEVPYFFSILLGLIAYQLNSITSIQFNAPTISYSFDIEDSKYISDKFVVETINCSLQNITNDKVIRNLNISIAYGTDLDSSNRVYNPEIISIAPSQILPDSLFENIANGELNNYTLPEIQPNSEYILKFTAKHNKTVNEFPKLYFCSSDSVRLKEFGWELFLVKHQIAINIILLLLWTILFLCYLSYLIKKKTK
jgi:hypothetical protein